MPFNSVLSEELKETIKRLYSKDKQHFTELNKKMLQIVDCDRETINHYKNLKYNSSDYKRVHIGKSFILLFSVDIQNNIIYFAKFEHHDKAYKR
ncbi:MAG: addiction module toxin RelE [archaeon]|jgi:mRNA-degrading endonuclease RelE of RelBE toxin-antitoxin system